MTEDWEKPQDHGPEDPLPESLAHAASLLRGEPAVRDEWRRSLLARAAGQRLDDRSFTVAGRGWRVRPVAAIAAGLACALLGSGATYLFLRERPVTVASGPARAVATAGAGRLEAEGARVRFALVAPGAAHVSIVGDFNQWSPTALPMRRLADGRTWEVEVPLPPGRYTYAFVVDGHLAADPSAPEAASDDFGVSNSVLIVKGS